MRPPQKSQEWAGWVREGEGGELGHHVRRRSCLISLSQYEAGSPRCRGWTRRSFNQGPIVSQEKGGGVDGEMERGGRGGEMNVSEAEAGVSRGCHASESDL